MGSTASICNHTELILNVALSQLGPMYYENLLRPGMCMDREVGKVWFTVDGRVWNGENDFTDAQVAIPITAMTLGVLSLGAGAVGTLAAGAISGVMMQVSRCLAIIGTLTGVNQGYLQKLIDGSAIHSPGWYFGNSRKIAITGGPKGSHADDNGRLWQVIDVNTAHHEFEIKEI